LAQNNSIIFTPQSPRFQNKLGRANISHSTMFNKCLAIAFLTMCTTTTSAVTTNDPQLRGNDPNAKADLTPLNQLKDAAATIGNNHCNSNSNPGPCPPPTKSNTRR
jgi:hypothetical protein